MENLIGRLAMVETRTAVGSETILGSIVPPLLIEGEGESEVVTHVTVKGSVAGERIIGLKTPVENREGVSVTLELIPITEIELL